jgi:hypothetical protein
MTRRNEYFSSKKRNKQKEKENALLVCIVVSRRVTTRHVRRCHYFSGDTGTLRLAGIVFRQCNRTNCYRYGGGGTTSLAKCTRHLASVAQQR